MQPKRHVSYRLLRNLGVGLRLTFGQPDLYAQVEILNSRLAVTLSRIWLVYKGVPLTGVESVSLSIEELKALSPEKANARVWKELKEFYLRNKDFGKGGYTSISKEAGYRIDEYCQLRGLTEADAEFLKLHADKITDIVEESSPLDFDSDLDEDESGDGQMELPL